jgi:hypothetical protein
MRPGAALTLDHLSPATTYYRRVKTSAGTVSASQSFSIGTLLVIQPPTPVQPLADDAFRTSDRRSSLGTRTRGPRRDGL